ncbi:hypothetical protein ABL78_2019 [Leptomonas seymouri]|uniref:Zinc finger Mcm10/DnaG-type domain-containing protein n=1 Tax=Leptomonas seymouri TaxID=5684 RepID=A0A0N1I857_LEPSE|nr:hypothetical protein ABL78_2019 [Leptomonas seymouri]|eukprot:KPI88902.1 hypothetical protein ABL78_2019 [Leptomonas seymouri]
MSDDLFDIFNEGPTPAGEFAEQNHAGSTADTGISTGGISTSAAVGDTAVLGHDADDRRPSTEGYGSASTRGGAEAPLPSASSFPSSSEAHPLAPQSPRADATPQPSMTPPLPLAALTAAPASSSGAKSGAVMIIRSSPAPDGRCSDGGFMMAPSKAAPPPPASAVITEPHSRIRVRRATVALEQLSVRLAEFPYASFALMRQATCRSGAQAAVPQTCVGVVTRKSDPKQSTVQARASRYAVLTLWNMESISPSPESEIGFLLCGNAFDLLYSQLVRGSVVALSNVGMCPRKGSSSGSSTGNDLDVLLRVCDHASVRQLGFAVDLGTCMSVSHKSNERCHVVVNTMRSQHCSYHVGGLRKVARGAVDITPSSNSSAHRSATVSSSIASTTPVMKQGSLTSHMTLFSAGARRASTLAPRSAALRPTAAVPSSAPMLVQRPVSTRLAASQQLLRQPSFFAVRGATGLPVEDAAQRRRLESAGTGVYGGVQSGAPLPLQRKVGLRPAERYPSAQKLGVTSRGRDVLEAARQQAVLSEEEKLLRRPLQSAEQKGVSGSFNGAESGGPSSDSLATAVRARERDLSSGDAPLGLDDRHFNKRTRTEAVQTSSASPSAPTRHTPPSTSKTAAADATRVEALRLQFQPIHHGTPAPFIPLHGQDFVHSVIPSAVQREYRHTVVIPGGGGLQGSGKGAQAALLRAAAKAAEDMPGHPQHRGEGTSRFALSTSSSRRVSEEFGKRASDETLPLTLLGAVADAAHSQHDHLRLEADRQRLHSFVDKQITKEKALEALEAVSQQEIKAYYCYGCRCWYAKPPTSCVEQHHRTELKPALKKYIKCEHCNYKTFVIGGEDAKGWKVFPRCPRCHEASFWVRGDAAPQIARLVEEPTPS